MIVAGTIGELDQFLAEARSSGKYVGLVPTMGALHRGHLSLVECCGAENDITVVTIFVNPAQFNDPEDLKNYPRDLGGDLQMLRETDCDVVFSPSVETVYPEPDLREFDFGMLDKIMEGHYRPGHFSGVARVVSRLFDLIKPHRAYFGEKDIQQLAIINKMAQMLGLPVEIVSCPTIRESDGLALSSRNVLLTPAQRENAILINRTLMKAAMKKDLQVGMLKKWVADTINENPFLELEYFEIVDRENLRPVSDMERAGEGSVGCIAVYAGNVRLIDNIFFSNFATL